MLKSFILLLPSFVCLYSAINFFINRKQNFRSQNIWMLCMFAMSISSFIWSIYYAGIENYKIYYKLDIIDATVSLAFLPFVHLYFRSLTDETPLGWKEYSWFLPGLFVGVSSIILYIRMGDARAAEYMEAICTDHMNLDEYSALVYKILFAINVVFYYTTLTIQQILLMIYTIKHLSKYQKRLDDYFLSNPDERSLKSIKATFTGILVLIMIYFSFLFEGLILRHQYPIFLYTLMVANAAVFIYLNYHVSQIKYTAESLKANLQQSDEDAYNQGYVTVEEDGYEYKSASVIKKERREEIIPRINALLEDEKIFLKKDLRMDDIVHLTRANRTYISLLINEEYKCSFSELINRRRIDHAQKLASENPNLSHLQIAEESGFTHASSFSRTFKQYVGITFREWHKRI